MFLNEDGNLLKLQVNLLVGCTLLLFYWLWSRRHFYKFALQQPGFWGFPLVGYIYRIPRLEILIDRLGVVFKDLKKHYAFLWLGPWPVFVISDPDLIGKALTSPSCSEKASLVYKTIARNIASDGLLTMQVDKWKHHRRLVNPSFRQQVLQSFFPVFYEELRSIISEFQNLADTKKEYEVFEIIKRHALNSVIKTTMGQKIENYDELYNIIIVAEKKGMGAAFKFVILAALQLSWLARFNFSFQKLIRTYQSYTKNIVQQRLETLNGGKKNTNDLDDESIHIKKPARIFIDEAAHLVESKQVTLAEVTAHANHIILGGFSTVTDALFGALLLLAMHPDKQERLYEEILEVAPEKTTEVSINELKSLPYLEMILNETLRLLPPAPIIARDCSMDTQFNANITVPKGTQIMIDIFHLHRNKEVWGDDAEQFKPERFESGMLKNLHPYALIPFSKSSRDCIGKKYADYFLKIMLIGLIRNFKFSTQWKLEDLKLVFNIHLAFEIIPKLLIEER